MDVPSTMRGKCMSEWACGGHGIVRCSLGREPSQRNISTHLSDMEVDRESVGKQYVYEAAMTYMPVA